MASTRNSPPADDAAPTEVATSVEGAVREFVVPGSRLSVALSGGIDSMVLLDALSRLSAAHPFELRAIHVNHGLSPHAEDWSVFCAAQCAARGVPLDIQRLTLERKTASLEAKSRAERYARLNASGADVVALAHHADDQAETVLLQMLRGAGPRGLSAMPRFRPGNPAWLRPLLGSRRATHAIRARRCRNWMPSRSHRRARRSSRSVLSRLERRARGDVARWCSDVPRRARRRRIGSKTRPGEGYASFTGGRRENPDRLKPPAARAQALVAGSKRATLESRDGSPCMVRR